MPIRYPAVEIFDQLLLMNSNAASASGWAVYESFSELREIVKQTQITVMEYIPIFK